MRLRYVFAVLSLSVLVAGSALAQGVSPESAEKYNTGQDLFKKRRYQEALKIFEEAVNLDGKNAQAYRAMGKTYQRLRNYKDAVDAFKMATTVKADYTAAYFELGQLQLQTKDNEGAQASLRKVLEIDRNFEEGKALEMLKAAHVKEGITLLKRRNAKAAAAQFESATQVDPSDATVFYNLGLAHKTARNSNAALEAFETAIDLDPNYSKAHRAIGDLLKATGKNSGAASAYLKAIKADETDTRSRLSLATVYEAMKQKDKALAVLKKAAQVDAGNDLVHNALGKAYYDAGQFKSALAAYNKAIAIKSNPEYHYRSAEAHVGLKQFKNAIMSAQKALSVSKWKVPANVVLADCYRELGEKDKAIEYYKRGVEDRRYKKYCEDQIDRILNPMGSDEEGE